MTVHAPLYWIVVQYMVVLLLLITHIIIIHFVPPGDTS